MKLQTKQNIETSLNLTEAKEFGFSHSAKMFKIVANLYSDKPRAIIRELCCNAYDSHVEAGKKDIPFDVFLPTQEEPYFKVHDYGIGLSENEIYEIYTVVGESTKDSRNDVIGALGLGTKSPLFYADAFTVEAIKDGTHNTFTCFLKDGYPNVLKLEAKETEASNGVIVTVPVTDIQYFNEIASVVFRPFDVKPNIRRKLSSYSEQNYNVNMKGDNWLRLNTSTSTIVRYGQIEYPLDGNMFKEASLSDTERSFVMRGFVLDMPLGTLDISPNREALSYDSRTVRNLVTVIEDVVKKYKGQLIPSIREALKKSKFERLIALDEIYNSVSGSIVQKEFFKEALKKEADLFDPSETHFSARKFLRSYGSSALYFTPKVKTYSNFRGQINTYLEDRIRVSEILDGTYKFVYSSENISSYKLGRLIRGYFNTLSTKIKLVVVPSLGYKDIPEKYFIDILKQEVKFNRNNTADDVSRYMLISNTRKKLEGENLSYNEIKTFSEEFYYVTDTEFNEFFAREKLISSIKTNYVSDLKNFKRNFSYQSLFRLFYKSGLCNKKIIFIEKKEENLKRTEKIKEKGEKLFEVLNKKFYSIIRDNKIIFEKLVFLNKSDIYKNYFDLKVSDRMINTIFYRDSKSFEGKKISYFLKLRTNFLERKKETIELIKTSSLLHNSESIFPYLISVIPTEIVNSYFGITKENQISPYLEKQSVREDLERFFKKEIFKNSPILQIRYRNLELFRYSRSLSDIFDNSQIKEFSYRKYKKIFRQSLPNVNMEDLILDFFIKKQLQKKGIML